jgi:hypothetical protein
VTPAWRAAVVADVRSGGAAIKRCHRLAGFWPCDNAQQCAPIRTRHPQPTPTSLDLAGLRWTLRTLRARPWTVLDTLAELCKHRVTVPPR